MLSLRRITTLDAALSARMRVAEKPGALRSLAVLLAHSGDSWFWFLGLGLLAAFGRGFWRWWAVLLFVAILGTALLVMTLKFSVRRSRPQGEWGQIYRRTDPHSFPSGHAARAALIGILTLGTGPAWAGALLCLWAVLVALARVSMGVHYLSDILAGATIGSLIALLVLRMV